MDKQEKLLRDILKEQKETNRLLKRIERQGAPTISEAEIEQFKNFRTMEAVNEEDAFYSKVKELTDKHLRGIEVESPFRK